MAKDEHKPGASPVSAVPVDPKPAAPVAKAPEAPPAAAKPAPAKPPAADGPHFRVTLGDVSEVIPARDADEAWAKFCDRRKSWPGPKASGRTVEPA